MNDLIEKVKQGLRCCVEGFDCPEDCPYIMSCNDLAKPMFVDLAADALALLEEQEAVEPQLSISGMWYECPVCHRHLTKDRDNYCARCGRSVKWEWDV